MGEALTTNNCLEYLDITCNRLCNDGIQHLAHALQVNQHLKTLSAGDCYITGVGIECLAKSLQYNHGLNTLELVNNINASGSRMSHAVLIECLPNNHTLTSLVLSNDYETYGLSSIEIVVNEVRSRNGLPDLEITILYTVGD